jgi:hypothetical protein
MDVGQYRQILNEEKAEEAFILTLAGMIYDEEKELAEQQAPVVRGTISLLDSRSHDLEYFLEGPLCYDEQGLRAQVSTLRQLAREMWAYPQLMRVSASQWVVKSTVATFVVDIDSLVIKDPDQALQTVH